MIKWLGGSDRPVRRIIGLMSGTSLDGVDAAVVEVEGSGKDTRIKLLSFITQAYDELTREAIKALCSEECSSSATICSMNVVLGELFAAAAFKAAEASGVPMREIDLISSHGQTIWHQPEGDAEARFRVRSTLQIGDISVVSKQTGRPVIGDYRPADIAVGGQGAPLTPYADYILFADQHKGRIVQNIGGIGNCTILPQGADAEHVTAFDTGPGNMLIDQAVAYYSEGREHYDADGAWAASGTVHAGLLDELLDHPYLKLPPVKTTGREMFGKSFAMSTIGRAEQMSMRPEDVIATFTAFTAHSIALAYREFVFPQASVQEVIVSGGGSHNRTLMSMLANRLPQVKLLISDELAVSGDAKEAIAFAIMANEFLHQVPNHLISATGAARKTVLGKLALP